METIVSDASDEPSGPRLHAAVSRMLLALHSCILTLHTAKGKRGYPGKGRKAAISAAAAVMASGTPPRLGSCWRTSSPSHTRRTAISALRVAVVCSLGIFRYTDVRV